MFSFENLLKENYAILKWLQACFSFKNHKGEGVLLECDHGDLAPKLNKLVWLFILPLGKWIHPAV